MKNKDRFFTSTNVDVVNMKALAEFIFRSKSYLYRNKPVVSLWEITKQHPVPFNNNTLVDWSFDKVNPFFPYVMVVSENGNGYYNVMLPGVNGLKKLKKKLLKPECLPILSAEIKRY
jgi:hypothetical protein